MGYDPKVSNWLSVDPIALYDPIDETEHYLDGQHNGGYFNPTNLSVYGYTYQNPIKFVDPNGKQNVPGAIWGGLKGATKEAFTQLITHGVKHYVQHGTTSGLMESYQNDFEFNLSDIGLESSKESLKGATGLALFKDGLKAISIVKNAAEDSNISLLGDEKSGKISIFNILDKGNEKTLRDFGTSLFYKSIEELFIDSDKLNLNSTNVPEKIFDEIIKYSTELLGKGIMELSDEILDHSLNQAILENQ